MFSPVTDAVLRNVALNKPSAQISTYTDEYGHHSASLANDGSRQTDYTVRNHGCAASNPAETNPWWAVDLGVPTLVVQVNLTNRGDAHGIRLHPNMLPYNLYFVTLHKNISCHSTRK